jgi:hypothetical protein
VNKRLRRITPVHDRQLACLWACLVWVLVGAGAVWGLSDTQQRGGGLIADVALTCAVAFMAVMMWRLFRAGLYLGPRHVRIRSTWRTRTVSRADLVAVSTAPYRAISHPDDPARSDAIILELASGERLVTPVRVYNDTWGARPIGPVYDYPDIVRALALLRDGCPSGSA